MKRLTRITTGSGDQGTTDRLGERVPKSHPAMEALGTVDELNALLGWVRAHEALRPEHAQTLRTIQNALFRVGTDILASRTAEVPRPTEADLQLLEKELADLRTVLPPLREFVLPGGSELSARLHMARTVCRRAERRLAALREQEGGREISLVFLNRLSDLLFQWARLYGEHELAQFSKREE